MRSGKRVLVLAGVSAVLGVSSAASAGILIPGTWSNDFSFASGETISPSGTSGSTFNQLITTNGNNGVIAPITSQSMSVGDSISLTGTVGWNTTNIGNDQFRFALENTNGSANSTSWLGYLAELPNSGAGIIAADKGSANPWASSSNLTNLTLAGGGTSANNGSPDATTDGINYTRLFNFSLTMTELTTSSYSVAATWSASDSTTTWSQSATDTTTPADSNHVFNEIGIFFGSATGISTTSPQNTIAFSNVQVTYTPAPVPEPASAAVIGLGSLCLLARRRRAGAE